MRAKDLIGRENKCRGCGEEVLVFEVCKECNLEDLPSECVGCGGELDSEVMATMCSECGLSHKNYVTIGTSVENPKIGIYDSDPNDAIDVDLRTDAEQEGSPMGFDC